MTVNSITFRPSTAEDLPLLAEIYASTRDWEMALLVEWSDEEKSKFLQMQHEAQHKYYHEVFTNASYDLILQNGQPIGRLYLDWREDELRIIDIALLSEHRGQGIGGQIMRDLLAQAAAKGKLVRIHVERQNPAMRLYERLGFKKIEEQGVYWLMEREPNQ